MKFYCFLLRACFNSWNGFLQGSLTICNSSLETRLACSFSLHHGCTMSTHKTSKIFQKTFLKLTRTFRLSFIFCWFSFGELIREFICVTFVLNNPSIYLKKSYIDFLKFMILNCQSAGIAVHCCCFRQRHYFRLVIVLDSHCKSGERKSAGVKFLFMQIASNFCEEKCAISNAG